MPTLALFQPYGGMIKFYIRHLHNDYTVMPVLRDHLWDKEKVAL
jgi:hypothetical protein